MHAHADRIRRRLTEVESKASIDGELDEMERHTEDKPGIVGMDC